MKTLRILTLIPMLTLGLATLPGCTADQQNTAKAVASAAIDAACNNLPNMDAQFQAVAPRANGAAQAGYRSAKAIITAACNNRPLTNPEQKVAAVSAAVAQIAAILAPLLSNGG